MSNSLLPLNATNQEVAISETAARIADVSVPLRDLWNPDACPLDLLPWLAWALSVDFWDPNWPEEEKRDTIRESIAIHRQKGTVGSIKRVLKAAGFEDSRLLEGLIDIYHDGVATHNGERLYGENGHWAEYRIVLTKPISNEQSAQVDEILELTHPARCSLKQKLFTQAAALHNNTIKYDGAFNHGAT